jgi:hypothetical protein
MRVADVLGDSGRLDSKRPKCLIAPRLVKEMKGKETCQIALGKYHVVALTSTLVLNKIFILPIINEDN